MKRRILSVLLSLAMCLSLLPANALAAEGADHICADADSDYHCDECWAIIPHDCTDGGDEEPHFCDLCYDYLRTLCADEDGDHACDTCSVVLSDLCKDETPLDHLCDNELCSNWLTECEDTEGDDNICDICGGGIYPSASALNVQAEVDGVEVFFVTWKALDDVGEDKVVSYTVYCFEEGGSYEDAVKQTYFPENRPFRHYFFNLINGTCYEIGVCADYESGYSAEMSILADYVHLCVDEDGDYYCDECWEVIPHDCIDGGDEDFHYCDLCYEYLRELCVDENNDHCCEVCFTVLSDLCRDEAPLDHYCDNELCSNRMTYCEDFSNDDNVCTLCGEGVYPDISELNTHFTAENDQVIVTWDALEDVGEEKVVAYSVSYLEEGGNYEDAVTVDFTPGAQSFEHIITGLELDVPYDVWVSAEYEQGHSYDSGDTITLYSLWVGGTQVTSTNHWDVFDDGTVSYDPDTATLKLEDYQYVGDGYLYYTDDEGAYSAVLCSRKDLAVELVGENSLTNTFTDPENKQYGDGVVVNGNLSITGTGLLPGINTGPGVLSLNNSYYGIDCGGSIDIADCAVYVTAAADGIYAYNGLSVTDGALDITAEDDGIYCFGGGITIDANEVTTSTFVPMLTGTTLFITAGTDESGLAMVSDLEPLAISDRLTISAPEAGKVQQFSDRWDSDDDGTDDTDYVYNTIVDADGNKASSVVIVPLGYHVIIPSLDYTRSVLVPVGQSVNETYRDLYGFEDFSELLKTDKTDYTFVGWYTDPFFGPGSEFTFDTPVTGDVTLHPFWVYNYPSGSGSSGGSSSGGSSSGGGSSSSGSSASDSEVLPSISFDDVESGAWYYDAVTYVAQSKLMQGIGDNRFDPDGTTTRAMLWTVLAKLDGVDTAAGSVWYEASQKWAMENGISDGSAPNGSITREQFVTMLYAYAKYKGIDVSVGDETNILSYEDAFSISEWAIPAVQWACGSGLMKGDGANLMPGASATRAQSATLLASFCRNVQNMK